MRQKIFEALRAKFPGSNAVILGRIADKLAKTASNDEQVTTAVSGVTQELIEVIESYGDSRATDAQQTAVKNYESQYGLKDGRAINANPSEGAQTPSVAASAASTEGGGTPSTKPLAAGVAGDQTGALLQQLFEQNKKLAERLDRMDGERTTADRRKQIAEITAKLPESLRKPYERIPVETLSVNDFTALLGEVTTEVDSVASEISTKGAVFGKPAVVHGGEPQGNALTEEQKAAIVAREGKASADGQPF